MVIPPDFQINRVPIANGPGAFTLSICGHQLGQEGASISSSHTFAGGAAICIVTLAFTDASCWIAPTAESACNCREECEHPLSASTHPKQTPIAAILILTFPLAGLSAVPPASSPRCPSAHEPSARASHPSC